MGQAAGSPQRQPCGAGSFLCHLNLHLGGPAHDGADLCELLLLLLLLLLLSQDKDEAIEHLSKTGRGANGPQETTKGFSLRLESYLLNRHSRAFRRTRGAQPSNNKTPDKHTEGRPDWLPNTAADAARVSGESTFFRASLQQQLFCLEEAQCLQ